MYLAAQALAAQAQGLGERTRASWGGGNGGIPFEFEQVSLL